MAAEPIRFEIRDSIAHCILSNPPKNVMDITFFNALTRLRSGVFPALNVSGMLLYGQGNHFSSGADLDELRSIYRAAPASSPAPFLAENIETFSAISMLSFPSVAVVNGCCLGAGLELALACRYRVASPHAVFSLPETTFGLIPGCGGTVRLPKLISRGKAIEMILSGRMVSAEEALAIGLIDACVERKFLMDKAVSLITQLQANVPPNPDRRQHA